MGKSVDWLQRAPLCLRFRSCASGRKKLEYPYEINELEILQYLQIEDGPGIDKLQQIHVDDVSELCLDVLFSMSDKKSEVNTQQTLKDVIDRFNERIRPLYN